MKNCFLALVILLGSAVCALAQNPSADEEAIRDAIAEINAGRTTPRTTDTVFWSGAYVKPYVQGEQPQARPGSSAVGNNRTNQKTAVKVLQLRVSASGDMAYEYSTFQTSWDRKDNGRHFALEGGLLRVWRKIDGKWQIAASFQHPYDNTPAEQ